jgi:hypothetical protein
MFREPHPVRVTSVIVGAAMSLAWQFAVAGYATTLRGLFWRAVISAFVALSAALVLLRAGDRGGAVGVGLGGFVGWSVATALVVVRWLTVGWPLW